MTGTAVYYYGNVAPWGGIMTITLGGSATDVNTIEANPPERRQSLGQGLMAADSTR
jgi:hypothetical protein